MKYFAALAMVLVLFGAAPVLAADVDGKWSTTGRDGGQILIKNGKIDGNNISFQVSLDFGGMPLELSYTGVISGTEIMITGDFAGCRSSSRSRNPDGRGNVEKWKSREVSEVAK